MQLVVNGETRECRDACSLQELLQDIGVPSDRAAVLVNDKVISAVDRAALTLRDADRVEILVFAGGG